MRILFIIGSLDRGGTETQLCQMLKLIDKSRFEPVVFLFSHAGDLAAEVAAQGVEVRLPRFTARPAPRLLRLLRLMSAAAEMFWLMLRTRPRIVHLMLPASYLIGGPLSLMARVPVKIMSRRSRNHYMQDKPAVRQIEAWLHGRMTCLLANSRAVVRDLETEGAPGDRIRLIYNGVASETFTAGTEDRDTLGLPRDRTIILMTANLIGYKGHADVISALSLLPEAQRDQILVLFAGRDGGMKAALEEQIADHGLQGVVRLLGSRSDVAAISTASDIGLLASHEEGFSNAILEYMAAGLPVIATDVGGNAEAVIDGKTGLIVPPENPKALAQAIATLAGNAPRRAVMGAAGHARATELFAAERSVAEHEALYASLV